MFPSAFDERGRWKEVPGRATVATEFSSKRRSPTPSSSISKSSIYCLWIRLLHLRSQAAFFMKSLLE